MFFENLLACHAEPSAAGFARAKSFASSQILLAALAAAVLATPAARSQTVEWSWITGSNSVCSGSCPGGVYGTLGTPAAANTPGARQGAVTWVDSEGNLWLFGGSGEDGAGAGGLLNDLWKFSPALGEWTWESGSSMLGSQGKTPGVYGTQGIPASTNYPGGREFAITWTDHNGNLWLFGGFGFDSLSQGGYLNDLWEFNPSTREWTWVSGSNLVYHAGVYGTPHTPGKLNVPGAREEAVSWTDLHGNFWLFGGTGEDSAGNFRYLNDLWEYDLATGEWAWMAGSSTINGLVNGATGVYGQKGIAASTNTPGGHYTSVSWVDASGNLWLFGGFGKDSTGKVDRMNDLWKFNPATLEWTWIGGSNMAGDIPGVYGTRGTPSADNVPGSRSSASGATDPDGNFWLFGGYGIDSTIGNFASTLDDLWEYTPSSGEWTWIGGASDVNCSTCAPLSVYGTKGTPAAANHPGGRSSPSTWIDSAGLFWEFGGFGIDAKDGFGTMNDLWAEALSSPALKLTPSPGMYATAQKVAISGGPTGQPIYYTLDNSAPTTSSAKYTGPISISKNETLKALSLEYGHFRSAISGYYAIGPFAAAPKFSLAAGTYHAAQSVTLSSATAGAVIYYTTNGATPTTSSTKYISAIKVTVTTTIKAIATHTGEANSAVASATYTLQAAAPAFTPVAGSYKTAQSVTLTSATPGAVIYYTTNGKSPTTSSTKYTGAIKVSATTTIKALATHTGYSNSAISSATFTIP